VRLISINKISDTCTLVWARGTDDAMFSQRLQNEVTLQDCVVEASNKQHSVRRHLFNVSLVFCNEILTLF
jgi:hypothetical protein